MAETKKTEAAAAAAPPEAACLTLRQKLVEMRKACPEIVKKQHSDGVSYAAKIKHAQKDFLTSQGIHAIID